MLPQILLVNPERPLTESLVPTLISGGYEVTRAADFNEAAGMLKARRFHAVVTAHRLGSHNGLHLVLRARVGSPAVLAVVTSNVRDAHLEAEAGIFGAVYLIAPWHDAARLLDVLRAESPHPASALSSL
jgi:DNA-binding response OmpR family regulator